MSRVYRQVAESIVSVNTSYTNAQNAIQSLAGSGFLMRLDRRVYIVTSANLVLTTNALTPVTSISVGIYSRSHRSLSALAEIVGVDASANVAVLQFTDSSISRIVRRRHALRIANSRSVKTGDVAYNISNPQNKDTQSFVQGIVRDPHFADPSGKILVPNIVTDLLVYGSSSGSPILNRDGEVIGLVSFGFADTPNTGYCGGVNSNILWRIVRNIVKKRNTATLLPGYVTNLKASLGNVTLAAVSNYNLEALYPLNYTKLQLRGFILTSTSALSPLSNLLNNEPALAVGDIIVFGRHENHTVEFGNTLAHTYPLGQLLWFVNPDDTSDFRRTVTFGVIRTPNTNSTITRVKTILNLAYDPSTETPLSNIPLRVTDPLTAQAGEVQATGTVNLVDLQNYQVFTNDVTSVYDYLVQDQTTAATIYPARFSGGRLFYLNTPIGNTTDVISQSSADAPIALTVVSNPPPSLSLFSVSIATTPAATVLSSTSTVLPLV